MSTLRSKVLKTKKNKENRATLCMQESPSRIRAHPQHQKKRPRNHEYEAEYAARIALPYYAPNASLPTKIPTSEEIAHSCEILQDRTAAKVVVVGTHFVVKYGEQIDLDEGRTMIMVKAVGIPVPRVYALYSEHGKNYIVMEHVHGKTLEAVWQNLSEQEKANVAVQIKGYLQTLRQIPSPGVYCSIDKQPLRDELFQTVKCTPSLLGCAGPFDTELELVQAIVTMYKMSEAFKQKATFYEATLPKIFSGHQPTFTHGDIQRKNIMIRADQGCDIALVFLDWECAGWYPTFWEYAQTISGCGIFQDDWHDWVAKFLDPFPSEYAYLYIIEREIGY